jgi:hypothetical protein
VVPCDVGGDNPTNDLCNGVFEERYAVLRPTIADAELGFRFRGLFRLRKINRQRLLLFLQDADAEEAVLFEKRQEMAALVHANKRQERVERDRRERVGSHPVGLTGSPRGGYDSDARSELAERVAKVCRGKRSSCHIRSF